MCSDLLARYSSCLEPGLPARHPRKRRGHLVVQEDDMAEVVRHDQGRWSLCELRTADREEFCRAQQLVMETGIQAGAIANCQVHVIATEIDELARGDELDL